MARTPGEQRVVAWVSSGIASGAFDAGIRLPTERDLATSLGISRSAVRRGFAALEEQGLIRRHVGRGTFVGPASSVTDHTAAAIGRATSPAEIMEVRLMLEPQIAALAATSATGSELEALQYVVAQAHAAPTTAEFERWDGALHAAIAGATHNAFLVRIFTVVNAVREEPLWGSLKARSFSAARRRDYQADHCAIVEALVQRDGELARRLMRAHITRVRANLLERE